MINNYWDWAVLVFTYIYFLLGFVSGYYIGKEKNGES